MSPARIEEAIRTHTPHVRISQLLPHQAVAWGIVALVQERLEELRAGSTHAERMAATQAVIAECFETWAQCGLEGDMQRWLLVDQRRRAEFHAIEAGSFGCEAWDGTKRRGHPPRSGYGDGQTCGAAIRAAIEALEDEIEDEIE